MTESQTTADVLMIRPANFACNVQTAESNRFQRRDVSHPDAAAAARAEFDCFVEALREAGVRVHVFEDVTSVITPDSVFPNNWISFHAGGTAVLYPMLAVNRRLERRPELIESLAKSQVFTPRRIVDLSPLEIDGHFLEGTGSLVLDRRHRIAYAARSSRTHAHAVQAFATQMAYETMFFDAMDPQGVPIYHTNVLLSIGSRFATVCSEAISEQHREQVIASLREHGRHVVEISSQQMTAFAGNMLELKTVAGSAVIAMSQRAADSLRGDQVTALRELAGPLVATPLTTIEDLGGGSARCMIAEIHGTRF